MFVGLLVGPVDGMKDGPSLGNVEGERYSENVGIVLGDCDIEGYSEGLLDGLSEGTFDEIEYGPSLGYSEGYSEGMFVGLLVGPVDRMKDGPLLGNDEGERYSVNVGIVLEDCDSDGYSEGLLDWFLEGIFDGY